MWNIPPELVGYKPTGSSIIDPESVLGDSGRFYHGYKDGKYFLPNDEVSEASYVCPRGN